MLSSEIAPTLFVAVALCGGGGGSSSSDSDATTHEGWTCRDLQIMSEVEYDLLSMCTTDAECDQILEGTGVCPTDDLILNYRYDAEYLLDWIEQADSISCDLDLNEGRCPETAEPTCYFSRCRWQ